MHNYERGDVIWRNNDRVDPEFKSEAQAIYGDRRVDCEHDPPDHDCWNALYDAVIAGAGASASD